MKLLKVIATRPNADLKFPPFSGMVETAQDFNAVNVHFIAQSNVRLTFAQQGFLEEHQNLLTGSVIIPNRGEDNLYSGGKSDTQVSLAHMEDSRDASGGSSEVSPGAHFFQGNVLWDRFFPFPAQDAADKLEGDVLLARVEKYLLENYDPNEVDRSGLFPERLMEDMKALGLLKIKIPKEYGGLGYSNTNYVRLMQMLGSYCMSLTVMVSAQQSIGVERPLKMRGTQAQIDRVFCLLGHGNLKSAFGLTEKGAGSDPFRMKTFAAPFIDAQGRHAYKITGEKLRITNGLIADIMILMVKTPSVWIANSKTHGKITIQDQGSVSAELRAERLAAGWEEKEQMTAFIAQIRDPDGHEMPGFHVFERIHFTGLKALPNAYLLFDEFVVSEEDVVGDIGDGLKMGLSTLNSGRLTLPRIATGAAAQQLRATIEHGRQRIQMGKTITDWQAGEFKLARMAADVFGMDAVGHYTTNIGELAEQKKKDVKVEAAMAKLFTSEAGVRVTRHMERLWAGGFFQTAQSKQSVGLGNVPVEQWVRETPVMCIGEGTTDVMHLFIAREAAEFTLGPVMDAFKMLSGSLSLAKFMVSFSSFAAVTAKMLIGSYLCFAFRNENRESTLHSKNLSPANRKHLRFIEDYAHRLNLDYFALLTQHMREFKLGELRKHGVKAIKDHLGKLAEKQVRLAQLADHATNLYAMTATLAYAEYLLGTGRFNDAEKAALQDLCDYQCRLLEMAIRMSNRVDDEIIALTRRIKDHIYADRYTFLYADIADWKFDYGNFENNILAKLKAEIPFVRTAL